MDDPIIINGIKNATELINKNSEFIVDHTTDQLFYLDQIIEKMNSEFTVLVNETYSRILMLEFESMLLSKAIKLNEPAIKVSDLFKHLIKTNCDDILEKIKLIKEMQENRIPNLTNEDLERINNNESDIDLGEI